MGKPTVLTLRVPSGLKTRIATLAEQQGVSLNQFAMYMLTTKVTELETNAFFENVKVGKSSQEIRADFQRVMAKLKSRPAPTNVPEWDQLPANTEIL